jgi:RimJ/RimL family protein N-acetyltransferase
MPTIKTARLTLAHPIMHDNMTLDHYLRWLSNETVTKFSEQRHRKHTNETQYQYLNWFVGNDDHFWEIQRTGLPIGSISAYVFPDNRIANVGVMIGDPRLWGHGYAAEAMDAVCNFLFDEGMRKIEGGCMAANHGMIRIFEKLGFKYEATIGSHFLLNGNPEDKVCYGKYREAKILPLKKSTG